jgi:hypothetical protein
MLQSVFTGKMNMMSVYVLILEDHKAAPVVTANVEVSIGDAAQEEPIYKVPQSSRRQKKPPTTKNDDLLW